MRIVLIHGMSGTRDGVEWPAPGAAFDLPDDEAAQLIGQGNAREAGKDDGAPVEFATVAPAETATAKRAKA